MTFGVALGLIKSGIKVTRKGWNGKDMFIAMRVPNSVDADYTHEFHRKDRYVERPYIYMKTVNDELVPWVASQTDILEDDWCVVDE